MSRHNKVNPGQYTKAGRLSPDDLGRQRQRQLGKTASSGVLQGKAGESRLSTTTATKTATVAAHTGTPSATTSRAVRR